MRYAFLLTLGALVASGASDTVSARSNDNCDNLTGRDRSRCLMKERQNRQDSSSQPQTSTRSSTSSESSISRPNVPRNASPGSSSSPGTVVTGSRVTISWSSVSGATEYDFGIRDVTTNQLVVDTQTSSTSYSARIEKGRVYRWNVRGCNSAGCSAFTSPLYVQSEPISATSATAQSNAGAISLPATFPLYNQHDPSNLRLYYSSEWANAIDTVDFKPHHKLTCLAVVYAMIEHARGNSSYKVGPQTWTDENGSSGISGIEDRGSLGSIEPLLAQFRQGNPVILWGPLTGNAFGHFVLAVGINSSGQIILHDPSGGKRVTVDPQSWRVSGGSVLSNVEKYRTVRF